MVDEWVHVRRTPRNQADLLASGETIESIVAEYPQLTREDILA